MRSYEDDKIIKTQQELIDLLYSQVVDLSMMSKIELGDDVIAEIKRLRNIIDNAIVKIMESKEEKKFTYEEMLQFAKHLMTNLLTENREENGIGEISGENLTRIEKELNKFVKKE